MIQMNRKEQLYIIERFFFLASFYLLFQFDQAHIFHGNVFIDGLVDKRNSSCEFAHCCFYENTYQRFMWLSWQSIVWHLHKCSAYLWRVSCVWQAGPQCVLNPAPKAIRGKDWQVCEWQNEYFFRNINFISLSTDYMKTPICFN